jgi:hypothetical protein
MATETKRKRFVFDGSTGESYEYEMPENEIAAMLEEESKIIPSEIVGSSEAPNAD